MNFTDAIRSIIKPHEEDVLNPLTTVWGEQLDSSAVLSEYPRPQLRRESFINLNGYWDYAITTEDSVPASFDGKILVPFSPETTLSGVEHILQPDETLWYRTSISIDQQRLSSGMHLLLHFGAVDYEAALYINDTLILTHQGGYLPFSADLTPHIKSGDNTLVLKVKDGTDTTEQARGKQTLHRGGIFYTPQSGIWQTVWMEWVPACHVQNLWFETDYDTRKVIAHIAIEGAGELPNFSLKIHADDTEIVAQTFSSDNSTISADVAFIIPEDCFHSWSPEDPFLYRVTLTLGNDTVESYFAMRLFTMEKQDDKPVFCLNHEPYFLMGVLDQGYWPDGLYTAPSDEALIYDIVTMKSLGFNMLRKHIKVEPARWYYHCDRLGMIVCQDMVNGGGKYSMPVISYFPTLFPGLTSAFKDSHYRALSRKDKDMRTRWEAECREMMEHLRFFPSIAIWCPFNEGWGQFDADRITKWMREVDSSRLIDSTSGWFDQNCGDFISIHNYFRPLSVNVKKWRDRGFFLSEYGGFACHIQGHSSVDRIFGYKRYDTLEDLQKAYRELIEDSLLPLKEQGLSGAVYTQLSDVEEEVNGILTYDRKINKLKP
ncbi:MAG: glycoside hydrolase family 2 [Lachnospiraceae bacterium]|nr:glycoside hydrolase family 2 [Lachnospiraceae bacterium]